MGAENYYEQDVVSTLEKILLAENVTIKALDKAIKAKFYMPVIQPTTKRFDAYGKVVKASTSVVKGSLTSNYIELLIPPTLLLPFMKPAIKQATIAKLGKVNLITVGAGVIPAGTEFIVEYLGGEKKLDKITIVGVIPIDPNKK